MFLLLSDKYISLPIGIASASFGSTTWPSHLPLAGADSRSAEAGARGAGSQSLSGIHAKPTHNSRSVQCIADASLGIIARRHVLSFVEIVAI